MKNTLKIGMLLAVMSLGACIHIDPIVIDINLKISKEVDDSLASMKALRGVQDAPATAPDATSK